MKAEFKGKTIILGVPNHFKLPERFKENLEYLGFEVLPIVQELSNIKIPLKDVFIHNYKKLKKNKLHKATVKKEITKNYQIKLLHDIKEIADFALIIRPDLYNSNVVNEIKNKSKLMVAFQWDGIERYPEVKNYITYFDAFFVFDQNDLISYPQFQSITNFYFDDLLIENLQPANDVFFVGSFLENRIDLMLRLSNYFDSKKLKTEILLNTSKEQLKTIQSERSSIKFINKPLSFKENIEKLNDAKILIDFTNDIHYGLSFRTFEALGYSKKLITNNPLVKSFDFYNPGNIYLIENENFDGLDVFLNTPYQPVNKDIMTKYSFTNWLKNVLQIEPQNKITIPYGTKN